MKGRSSFLLAASLVALGIAMRFLPHPANFAPIAAIALFSGAYLNRWYAFVLPLGAMVMSDIFLGLHSLIWATWGSFALTGLIGLWIRKHKNLRRVLLGSLAASLFFYLLTNWAVWAITPLYPKTPAGLLASYIAAVPFFRNTLLGDLFYSGLFFGLYESVAMVVRRRNASRVSEAINHPHHET